MENYKEVELKDIKQEEENNNITGSMLMYPEEGITYINKKKNNEEYNFMCWSEEDILNLEKAVDKIGTDKFFETINMFFENEDKILKIDDLEFEYRNMIMVGESFIMLSDSSTVGNRIRR